MIKQESEDRNGENSQHAAERPIDLRPLFCADNIYPLSVRSSKALFGVDALVQRGETFPVGGRLFGCFQRRQGL